MNAWFETQWAGAFRGRFLYTQAPQEPKQPYAHRESAEAVVLAPVWLSCAEASWWAKVREGNAPSAASVRSTTRPKCVAVRVQSSSAAAAASASSPGVGQCAVQV